MHGKSLSVFPRAAIWRSRWRTRSTRKQRRFAFSNAVDLRRAGLGFGLYDDIDEIGDLLAAADPVAEIRIALRCPACGNEQDEVLDIATFLWAEVAALAKRLLREVHALASAYGWTEAEALSLSAARRSLYMEMVQA